MQYKDEFDHSPQIIQYSGMKTFGYPTILPYPNLGMNKQRLLGNSEWRRIDLIVFFKYYVKQNYSGDLSMNDTSEQPTPPQNETVLEQDELAGPEDQVIDLNEVFPEEENDLNDLFPDEETRILLKRIQKNKKDLHTLKDRFVEENLNEVDSIESPIVEDSPTEPSDESNN